jgi:hypothetical protein
MTCGLAGARRIRGCAAAQSCGNSPILSLFGRAIISGILLDQSPLEEDSSVHEDQEAVGRAVAQVLHVAELWSKVHENG